jgi:hypothetical protein
MYHQTAAQNDQFLAVSYSSFRMMTSATTNNNLNAAAANNFNIGYQYGQIL